MIDLLNAFSDRRVALGIVLAGVVFFGAAGVVLLERTWRRERNAQKG